MLMKYLHLYVSRWLGFGSTCDLIPGIFHLSVHKCISVFAFFLRLFMCEGKCVCVCMCVIMLIYWLACNANNANSI